MTRLGYSAKEINVARLSAAELARLCRQHKLDPEGSTDELRERIRSHTEERTTRAMGRELPIPWKKSVELARAIRGRAVENAREYLERVIALQQPVRFRRFNRWVAHKPGHGPARYPVKTARYFLRVLESAVGNAEFTGKEDPDSMVLRTVNAHKGMIIKGSRPRAQGRSSAWNKDTVNLEIVLEEVD